MFQVFLMQLWVILDGKVGMDPILVGFWSSKIIICGGNSWESEMMMVNIATKKMRWQMKVARVRKMWKTLSMGMLLIPSWPDGAISCSKRRPLLYWKSETDNKDEAAMCQDPDCNSTTIINKDILWCDSLGCYLMVRVQITKPVLHHMSRLGPEACWRLVLRQRMQAEHRIYCMEAMLI